MTTTITTETKPWEGWVILELLGHRRLGGYLTQVEIAGAAMLRIDVPAAGDDEAATQFYSAGAVYAITPTTETMARAVAESARVAPVQRWELKALEAPRPRHEDDFAEDEDDDGPPY